MVADLAAMRAETKGMGMWATIKHLGKQYGIVAFVVYEAIWISTIGGSYMAFAAVRKEPSATFVCSCRICARFVVPMAWACHEALRGCLRVAASWPMLIAWPILSVHLVQTNNFGLDLNQALDAVGLGDSVMSMLQTVGMTKEGEPLSPAATSAAFAIITTEISEVVRLPLTLMLVPSVARMVGRGPASAKKP
jgi:hypothetical protein